MGFLEGRKPSQANVTCTIADTEYSLELPAGTVKVEFWERTKAIDIRWAWATGLVATPTAPYLTLVGGETQPIDGIHLNQGTEYRTLYLASSTAGAVVEIQYFTY